MPNTYFDSVLTENQMEAALTAIDRVVVPANNGKVLVVEGGVLAARSVSSITGETDLEPLSVTENGNYYPPVGVDGFSEVHVNVEGGDDGVIIEPASSISIPNPGSSVTVTMDGITENHQVIRWNFSTSPENQPPANLTVTTSNGSFILQNTGGITSETVRPVFALPEDIITS